MREHWWIAADAETALDAHGLPRSVPAMMAAAAAHGTLLSSDRQSAAVRMDGTPPLLLKWRRPRRGRRWKTFGRASRERKEARALLLARALCIYAPAPLAVGERRRGGFLEGAVLLRPFLPDLVPGDRSLQEARAAEVLEARLAKALAGWHQTGFRHGDCYPKNVLVTRDGAQAVPIGAPAAVRRRMGGHLDRARLKDLAQWAAGARDLFGEAYAFRFLPAYAEAAGLAGDLAGLERRVRRPYERILARKARRIATRPLREPFGPPTPIPLPSDAPESAPPAQVEHPLAEWADLGGGGRPKGGT